MKKIIISTALFFLCAAGGFAQKKLFKDAMEAGRQPNKFYVIQNDKNGIIVPFNDSQTLATAITRLADSPSLSAKYGQAARCIVEERFNAKRVAEAVTTIYKRY